MSGLPESGHARITSWCRRGATTGLMRRSKSTKNRGRSCKVRPRSPSLRRPPYWVAKQ